MKTTKAVKDGIEAARFAGAWETSPLGSYPICLVKQKMPEDPALLLLREVKERNEGSA